MTVHVVRRLGTTPRQRGSATNVTCPDVFELSDGRFAIIGTASDLPAGPGEHTVIVPRNVIVAAKPDIPEA